MNLQFNQNFIIKKHFNMLIKYLLNFKQLQFITTFQLDFID